MGLRLHRKFNRQDPAELNITAFLNLMVILVPFLLITAVFSRLAILELNIPPAPDKPQQQQELKKEFQLVVTVRKEVIEVGDTLGGLIQSIGKKADGEFNYEQLSRLMIRIKSRFPDKDTVSILMEPDVSYNTLVQIMDKVRVGEQLQGTELVRVELFPGIAFGDAPQQ